MGNNTLSNMFVGKENFQPPFGFSRRECPEINEKPHKLWVRLFVILFFLFMGKNSGYPGPASWPIIFTFEPGSKSNSLKLLTRGNQKFAVSSIEDAAIARMVRGGDEEGVAWYFDVPDGRWFKIAGDGFLTLDFVATISRKLPVHLIYDSFFHEYHKFSQSEFSGDLEGDSAMELIHTRQICSGQRHGKNLYKLRKVFFGNRLENFADFKLKPANSADFGILRITLVLWPSHPGSGSSKVAFDPFVDHIFQLFLNRKPTPREKEILKKEFVARQMSVFLLLRNILRSWDFLGKNLFSFGRGEFLKRFFNAACRRNPSISEINAMNFKSGETNQDWPVEFFLRRYYGEIVEKAIGEITGGKP